MNLTLEIEFLTGVCRAAREPGNNVPDWPPQPDRVFSALVSAWGARGESPDERAALEWLENQPTPVIRSSTHSVRTAPDVYVPPNDFKASRATEKYLKILPNHRPRQPRRFPVARPDDPNLEIIWPDAPTVEILDALNAVASCVGYVGHSASLARCRFLRSEAAESEQEPQQAYRRVYPGRLSELKAAHRAKPWRPMIRPGAPVIPKFESTLASQGDWLVLEAIQGDVPDIRATALVCRLLRQAIMAGYRKAGLGGSIPEIISGHAPDGAPTRHSHLAVAPMAFVDARHADGRVFGFALIPPSDESLSRINGFRQAFEAVADYRADEQRRILVLRGQPLHEPLELAPAPNVGNGKRSLRAEPYLRESSRWASVTPVVLERHLKRDDETEVRELVARACENAGLPTPELRRIWTDKHSMIAGAPASRALTGAPPWTRWKVPKSLQTRRLIHTVVEFDQPVRGPVLLGAGRFTGLGLCRGIGK